jgi:hypothetical protein
VAWVGAVIVLAPLATPARAEPVTLTGITFSDELGGFVIIAGWGSGTPDDPFVVVERITEDGPAVLTIRGLTMAFGNPVRSSHFVGFALTKVVINATGRAWHDFGLGLEERLGQHSNYYDGLSFAQADDTPRRGIASHPYSEFVILDEPSDGVMFRGGVVQPGGQVVFQLVITDNTPISEFYLVQHRQAPIVLAPALARDRG